MIPPEVAVLRDILLSLPNDSPEQCLRWASHIIELLGAKGYEIAPIDNDA